MQEECKQQMVGPLGVLVEKVILGCTSIASAKWHTNGQDGKKAYGMLVFPTYKSQENHVTFEVLGTVLVTTL